MTPNEVAAVRRSLFIERLCQAITRNRQYWTVVGRSMTARGLEGYYEVYFHYHDFHRKLVIDLENESMEAIRKKFHFAEAAFLFDINPVAVISLTELPTPDMVEVRVEGPEVVTRTEPKREETDPLGVVIIAAVVALILLGVMGLLPF